PGRGGGPGSVLVPGGRRSGRVIVGFADRREQPERVVVGARPRGREALAAVARVGTGERPFRSGIDSGEGLRAVASFRVAPAPGGRGAPRAPRPGLFLRPDLPLRPRRRGI